MQRYTVFNVQDDEPGRKGLSLGGPSAYVGDADN